MTIDTYLDYAKEFLHTGSRVICDPPVKDTDDDWMLLISPSVWPYLEQRLKDDGFEVGGSFDHAREYPLKQTVDFKSTKDEDIYSAFRSYKKVIYEETYGKGAKGIVELNILVTLSKEYFDRYTKATFLSKKLNLRNKDDRISVFSAIVWDEYPLYLHLMETTP